MTTLEKLFEDADRVPTFEQVVGVVKNERTPVRCCVTGQRIRNHNVRFRGDTVTRYRLPGTPFYVFATRPLTEARLAALTAIAKAAKPSKAVKEASNG